MLYRKSKGKVHPTTGHVGREGKERYSSTLSLTSGLDGVSDKRHSASCFSPGEATRSIAEEAA